MKASEHLRAINAAMAEWRWEEGTEMDALLTSLPLIADVVEAAEWEVGMTEATAPSAPRLPDALTALRDALEER